MLSELFLLITQESLTRDTIYVDPGEVEDREKSHAGEVSDLYLYLSRPAFCLSLFQNKTERGESIQMAEVCDPGSRLERRNFDWGIRYKSAQMSPENLYTRDYSG